MSFSGLGSAPPLSRNIIPRWLPIDLPGQIFVSAETTRNCEMLVGTSEVRLSFADETFHDLRKRDIVDICDLCHFGVRIGSEISRTLTFRGCLQSTPATSHGDSHGFSSIRRLTRCLSVRFSRPWRPLGY